MKSSFLIIFLTLAGFEGYIKFSRSMYAYAIIPGCSTFLDDALNWWMPGESHTLNLASDFHKFIRP